MTAKTKKTPINIKCASCGNSFRLWVPVHLLSKWGSGEDVHCIKCEAHFLIKNTDTGVSVTTLEVEATPAQSAPAAPGVATTPEKAVPKTKEVIRHDKSVIFTDSDKLSAAIAENSIMQLKVNVLIATSGTEALELYKARGADLIITDLHLRRPGEPPTIMDGEELIEAVAANGKNTPVIIVTGKELVDEMSLDPKWYELHVKGFIQKGNPFWADELKDKITEVLQVSS